MGYFEISNPYISIFGSSNLISDNKYALPHPTSNIFDLLFKEYVLISFFATPFHLPGIYL